MVDLSQLTFRELINLHTKVGVEMLARTWWVYAVIAVIGLIGFILYFRSET